jgi:ATP-dependent DNA helicase DinG
MSKTVPEPQFLELEEVFGPRGPLGECLTGFAPRPEQLAMAQEVAAAISLGHNLLCEAGTGTGKTLAYLVPALLSGRRVIISTGTRTLQDQLYHRDLPTLGRAFGRPVAVQQLKGRSNYLCRYRLDLVADGLQGAPRGQLARSLAAVRRWAEVTRSGDVSELGEVAEDSPVWPRVTSTLDNCLGARCARFADCHVVAARQAAREADIVVVNHHLLMADLTLKEEGFGELLPDADVVVVDEAHHFPDVAQAFFNLSMSSRQVDELLHDARHEAVAAGMFDGELDAIIDQVQRASREARLRLPDPAANLEWSAAGVDFADAFSALGECLVELVRWLESTEEPAAGLHRCRERATSLANVVETLLTSADDSGLRWLRVTARGFVANRTPFETAPQIQSLMESSHCSWIFTSATLAVESDFSHFAGRLGLQNAMTRQIPSPFDFGRNARLYLPASMPAPGEDAYTHQVIAAVRPVLEASRGRAFLLFTSHRALRRAAAILGAAPAMPFPLLIQGATSRSRLLEEFAQLDNGVLLGTATFWEGVDIRGRGLVLVMIDRLPFASPGDPMLAARLEAIRQQGGKPFLDYQLPQAVLALKQGVGRLIRGTDDFGVVMICDPRILAKGYGRVFLESLPPMPVIRDLDEVRAFFAERDRTA